jgi:hypothetical protein
LEFAEVKVEEFDDHADMQIKMWNQFMRKSSQTDDNAGSLIISKEKLSQYKKRPLGSVSEN